MFLLKRRGKSDQLVAFPCEVVLFCAFKYLKVHCFVTFWLAFCSRHLGYRLTLSNTGRGGGGGGEVVALISIAENLGEIQAIVIIG